MEVYKRVQDVANDFNLSISTIKKYYLLIEDNGYRFKRNQAGQLMFSNHDVEMMRHISRLKNEPGMTLERAIQDTVTSITDPKEEEKDIVNVELNEIKILIHKQNELIESQQKDINRLIEENKQKLLIEEKNNQLSIDRDKTLMETLKVVTEIRKKSLEKKWWEIWKQS